MHLCVKFACLFCDSQIAICKDRTFSYFLSIYSDICCISHLILFQFELITQLISWAKSSLNGMDFFIIEWRLCHTVASHNMHLKVFADVAIISSFRISIWKWRLWVMWRILLLSLFDVFQYPYLFLVLLVTFSIS